ncbi:hypothetical protein [Neobacillus vireti]|uniref:hypothetical protein n=1 Tax=Neobacillus vireti TaxID=220686 RepID=UPI002FFE2287
MGSFLAVIGFLGFILFIIMAIVSAFRKTGKGKKRMLFAVGCFVLMIIGGELAPDAKETANSKANVEKKKEDSSIEKTTDETKKKEEVAVKKKEEVAAKMKAEDEAKAKEEAERKAAEEKSKQEEADEAKENKKSESQPLTEEKVIEIVENYSLGEDDKLINFSVTDGEIKATIDLAPNDMFSAEDMSVTRYSQLSDELLNHDGWEILTITYANIGTISMDRNEKKTNEYGRDYLPTMEIEKRLKR